MAAKSPEPEQDPTEAGRRCHVVLLFSDLSSYTTISEHCDPENVAKLLGMMKTQAGPIIESHGGLINQFYGDGFLAVFGLPSPKEEDVRHATTAALELHQAIRDLALDFSLPEGLEPRLHSGIHSGLIFARKTSLLHGRYELIGDAVNTAARLCAIAVSDEILASQETLEGAKEFFHVRKVPPLQLKGKEEPTSVYRVIGRTDVQTRFEASEQRGFTRFIARGAEFKHLQAALTGACSGKGRVVYVEGDAGIGKTRLLYEFEHGMSEGSATVLRGLCQSAGRIAPFEPFQQVLRQRLLPSTQLARAEALLELEASLLGLDAKLADSLPQLAQLLFLDEDPEFPTSRESSQTAIRQALIAVLLAVSKQTPLVLLLDDWHWADDASWQALRDLSSLANSNPLLIIVGSRVTDRPSLADAHQDTLRLLPFTSREAEIAAQSWLSGTLDAKAVLTLIERAGGNPLFLEELCLSWSVESKLRAAGPEASRVPSTLHGLVASRIERLPARHAELVRIAAVLGTEFEAELLAEVSAFSDVLSLLQDLAGYDLIYATETPGRFRYKHGLTRDIAYDSVRLSERHRIHRAVAHAIYARHAATGLAEHLETLAYHYAGAAEHELAAEYAEKAGDKAALASALDRVRQQYRAALLELDRLKQTPALRQRWLALVRKWAAACVYSPAEEQLVLLERASTYATLEGDRGATAYAHYWIGWIHYALGEQEASIRSFQAALELAQTLKDERLSGQLLANLGQSHAAAGNYAESLRCLDAALGAKRNRAPSGSGAVPVGFAYALGTKGLIYGDIGHFTRAYQVLEESLSPVRARTHAIEGSLLGLLGMVQLWQGQWEASLETAERARAVAEVVGEPYVMAIAQTVRGAARCRIAGDRSGLAELTEAKEWLDRRRIRLYLSFCAASLAELALAGDDLTLALENANFAVERAAHGDRLGQCLAHRVLAECAARMGDQQKASLELSNARTLAISRSSHRDLALTEFLESRLNLGQKDATSATAQLELARARLLALGMHWHATQPN